jgi:hypothetical protein
VDDEGKINLSVGRGAWWAKVAGLTGQEIMLFLIFTMLAALFYVVLQSDRDREVRYARVEQHYAKMYSEFVASRERDARTHANQDALRGAIVSVGEEQKGTTYVLTLSETERKALRLQEPEVIRNRNRR